MDISAVSIASVFAAGLISFLSPCVLPLVPGYVSYVAGGSLEELRDDQGISRRRLAALMLSAFFVLGFTTVFVALGASASAVGGFLLQHKTIFEYVAGGVIIVFGIYLTGLIRIPFFEREMRFAGRIAGGRPASAYLLGAAFAFGWTPCIGPVLGGILTLTATSADVGRGVALLAVYSLGLGVPFLIAAAFTGFFLRHMRRIRKVSKPLQIGAGVILIAMGGALITGYLSSVAFWLLEAFPGPRRRRLIRVGLVCEQAGKPGTVVGVSQRDAELLLDAGVGDTPVVGIKAPRHRGEVGVRQRHERGRRDTLARSQAWATTSAAGAGSSSHTL